mgnify:CR=1 FL=1
MHEGGVLERAAEVRRPGRLDLRRLFGRFDRELPRIVPADPPPLATVQVTAAAAPTLRERYAAIDTEPVGGTPEAFAEFVKKESAKWADVVKKSGAKVD